MQLITIVSCVDINTAHYCFWFHCFFCFHTFVKRYEEHPTFKKFWSGSPEMLVIGHFGLKWSNWKLTS